MKRLWKIRECPSRISMCRERLTDSTITKVQSLQSSLVFLSHNPETHKLKYARWRKSLKSLVCVAKPWLFSPICLYILAWSSQLEVSGSTMCKQHGTPAHHARLWLTTVFDLDRETKAIVVLKDAFPGRPDVVAREAEHMQMRGCLSDKIDELEKAHQAVITQELIWAGFRLMACACLLFLAFNKTQKGETQKMFAFSLEHVRVY